MRRLRSDALTAREVAHRCPIVAVDAPAADAARIIIDPREEATAVIVVDHARRSTGVLPDADLLRFVEPLLRAQAAEGRGLAAGADGRDRYKLWNRLGERRASDLLSGEVPEVTGEATLLDVASVMVSTGTAMVAVWDGEHIVGLITRPLLLSLVLHRGTLGWFWPTET